MINLINKSRILLTLLLCTAFNLLNGQILFTEDFDTGTMPAYTVTLGAEGSDGNPVNSDYFLRTDGSDIDITYTANDDDFFAGQDIDGFTGGANPSQLTWSGINIMGQSDLIFEGLFGSAALTNIDDSDEVIVQYQIDNGGWMDLLAFQNDGTQFNTFFLEDTDFNGDGDGIQLTSTLALFSKSIPGTGNLLDIRITAAINSGDEDIAFDKFIITAGSFPQVSVEDVTINEGDIANTLTITVSMSESIATDVTMDINTMDGSATTADNDYVALTNLAFTVPAMSTSATFDITINGDTDVETNEDFSYTISNLSSNAILADATGIATLQDDDDQTVLMSEVSICDQQVEFVNVGTDTIDLSDWRLCNFPAYDDIGSMGVTVVSGDITNFEPGDFVTLGWSDIGTMSGELGLYLPGSGFGNADFIHDYVQYNSSNNQRAGIAVTAGIWDDASLGITAPTGMGCSTIIANAGTPTTSNSTTWCEAATNTINPPMMNSNCSTGVSCPNVGDLIITEIMNNPNAVGDNNGEYFEIYNTTGSDIDIEGFQIKDADFDAFIIANGAPLNVPANGYLVLGNNADVMTNGGVTVDYSYGGDMFLSNSGDELIIVCDPLGTPTSIDTVAYSSGNGFPSLTGISLNLNPNNLNDSDNDDGANWCESSSMLSGGDLGTPGAANDACPIPPAISIDDVTMSEGDMGTTTFTFTVSSTEIASEDITFDINTMDGTATVTDSDYTAIVSGMGTITMGSMSTTIDVLVTGDMTDEDNETFTVVLSNLMGANATFSDDTGLGTISDDDGACPGMLDLTGTESGTVDYESSGVINSTQIIESTAMVDYDSATEINLNIGFEVMLGAVFSAFIDGCGGSMAEDGETPSSK